ncbi:MAG: BamA/TamA family outer membrane protein [Desulfuromonadaceae bacterium]
MVYVTGAELENVQSALELPPGLVADDGAVDRRWLQHFVDRIPVNVGQALEPFGYYQTITRTRLEKHQKNGHRVLVEIDPGKPVRITALRVVLVGEGRHLGELLRLVDAFPLAVGDVLRQDLYERGKGKLKAEALALGFLAADFSRHEIRVDRIRRQAEIDLLLDTKQRYHFGTVSFIGAPDYPEWFLNRFLDFSEGEIFSHEKLGKTQLNLLDSDRFNNVIVAPQSAPTAGDRVPVAIQLSPLPRRRLRPGVGYGTDTGGRCSLRFQNANLWHRAHLLKIDLLLAQRRQSLVFTYQVPAARNLTSQTAFRLGYTAEDVSSYETRSIFAEVERVWGFGQGRQGAVFTRLSREEYWVGEEHDRSRMILPGFRFSQRRYSQPIRPSRGYGFSFEARGAARSLGSDVSLLQLLASGNALLPLPARFSLWTRVEGGTTLQDEPLEDIPATLRFFAGGDRSVRGYAYQSLGPKNAQGETVGGKHLAVASLELEKALGASWGVACFYDMGNAFNDLTALEWAQGAGVGIRYYTQLGPVKIDLARQLGEPDPKWRLHLSIGLAW